MGSASFSLDFSISILPYTLWPKAGLGWDLRPILEESRIQQMK